MVLWVPIPNSCPDFSAKPGNRPTESRSLAVTNCSSLRAGTDTDPSLRASAMLPGALWGVSAKSPLAAALWTWLAQPQGTTTQKHPPKPPHKLCKMRRLKARMSMVWALLERGVLGVGPQPLLCCSPDATMYRFLFFIKALLH